MWKKILGLLIVAAAAAASAMGEGVMEMLLSHPETAMISQPPQIADGIPVVPDATGDLVFLNSTLPPPVPVKPTATAKVRVSIPAAYSPHPVQVCGDKYCPSDAGQDVRFIGRIVDGASIRARVKMLDNGDIATMDIRLVPGTWITEKPVDPGEVPSFR